MKNRNAIYTMDYTHLEVYPYSCVEFKPDPSNQVTIGDLHANALKFLHFLVFQNVIQMDPKDYRSFVKIYKTETSELTKEQLADFEKILANIKVLPVGLVRLIGDELSDRGRNDYFILKIIETLGKNRVPFEILFSNHSAGYFNENMRTVDHGQARSYSALQSIISKGLVKQTEIDNIINTYYKPNLKLISYSIDDSTLKPTLTIYTHAAVGLETVANLAKKLKIAYQADSLENLCKTIDQINENLVKINLIESVNREYTAFLEERSNAARRSNYFFYGYNEVVKIIPLTYPILRAIWTRSQGDLDNLIFSPSVFQNQYDLRFVHGHEGKVWSKHGNFPTFSFAENMINLDGEEITIGKDVYGDCGNNEGIYFSLFSQDKLRLATKLQLSEMKLEQKPQEIPKGLSLDEIKITESKGAQLINCASIPVIKCQRDANPEAKKAIEKTKLALDAYIQKRYKGFFSCFGDTKAESAGKVVNFLVGNKVQLTSAEWKVLSKNASTLQKMVQAAREEGMIPDTFEVIVPQYNRY